MHRRIFPNSSTENREEPSSACQSRLSLTKRNLDTLKCRGCLLHVAWNSHFWVCRVHHTYNVLTTRGIKLLMNFYLRVALCLQNMNSASRFSTCPCIQSGCYFGLDITYSRADQGLCLFLLKQICISRSEFPVKHWHR